MSSQATEQLKPLQEHLERARDLVQRRGMVAEQLLQLQPLLVEIQGRCSSPDQLVDEQAVLGRLNGLRNRLSRWLGRQRTVNERQQLAEEIIELAAETVSRTQEQCQQLEQQRQLLVGQLACCTIAQLANQLPLHDPPRSAELLWRQWAERRQDQWLRAQLGQQRLRNWRIEGFGEGRMALLERHGLERGDQLLVQIEQLTALPGIGRGLQQRLRQHLQAEIKRLQGQPDGSSLPGPEGDAVALVLGAAMVDRIQHHQQDLDRIQSEAAALAICARELNQEIDRCIEQRDALLDAYQRLF